MQYDAELYSMFDIQPRGCAGGFVFNDAATHGNHPFPDGTPVRISVVRAREGDIITTSTGTRYKLLKEYPNAPV